MVVISPLEGSPAEEAGLKAGDVVLAIDGSSTDGLTLDDAVAKVRGKRGTQVTLTLKREGTDAPLDLTITRDVIVVKDVSAKTLEDGTVGYLRVAHFTANVGKDFKAALKVQLEQGLNSFVLVDKGSASAAEIVAAALQENERATLVGETTFGKGTVQEWQLLSQDAGGVRLTIAQGLTPANNWVHSAGGQ